MSGDMWSSDSPEGRAARETLATMRDINIKLAQYINELRRVVKGEDPYAGTTVTKQLQLAHELAGVVQALMSDCEVRSAAVDKYGELVLTLLEKEGRVRYGAMVETWGESDDLTFTLTELLREGLIDLAGAEYWILPKGTLKITRRASVAAPTERPAVSGGSDA